MPILPPARKGRTLQIKSRPVPFSFWPTYEGATRIGTQSTVFALDPWLSIKTSLATHCPLPQRREASAYLEQAKDFYTAATSAHVSAARPLLLYYSFMNLAKAFVLHRGHATTLERAMHGLRDTAGTPGQELTGATLRVDGRGGTVASVFRAFADTLAGVSASLPSTLDLGHLVPQILSGHRLWADASQQDERFISVHEVQIMEDKASRALWLNLLFFEDDLARLGVSLKRLIREAGLSGGFKAVKTTAKVEGRKLACCQGLSSVQYMQRPSDAVASLTQSAKGSLWATVSSVPPYRRYYVYLSPVPEHPQRLPQLLSIYAVAYFLGSVTRYRPHHFDAISAGLFGARVEEFITGQPLQFLYLMASEFAKRDVTRPSIV